MIALIPTHCVLCGKGELYVMVHVDNKGYTICKFCWVQAQALGQLNIYIEEKLK